MQKKIDSWALSILDYFSSESTLKKKKKSVIQIIELFEYVHMFLLSLSLASNQSIISSFLQNQQLNLQYVLFLLIETYN